MTNLEAAEQLLSLYAFYYSKAQSSFLEKREAVALAIGSLMNPQKQPSPYGDLFKDCEDIL